MGLFLLSSENRDVEQEVLGTGLLRNILGIEGRGKSVKMKHRRKDWGWELLGRAAKQVAGSHMGACGDSLGAGRGACAGSRLLQGLVSSRHWLGMAEEGRSRLPRGCELALGFLSFLPPPPSLVLFTPMLRAGLPSLLPGLWLQAATQVARWLLEGPERVRVAQHPR